MADTKNGRDKKEKWITILGRRVLVKPGENPKLKVRGMTTGGEKKPARTERTGAEPKSEGSKGSDDANTEDISEQTKKQYIDRINLTTEFRVRDPVVYETYTKSGIIVGLINNMVKISEAPNNKIVVRHRDTVFQKADLLTGGYHWDSLQPLDRLEYLDKCHLNPKYMNKNWADITKEIRNFIKIQNPAGDGSGYGSGGPTLKPQLGPMHNTTTISERIETNIQAGNIKNEASD